MAKASRKGSTGASKKAAPKKASSKAASKSSNKPAASQFPGGGSTATEDKELQDKASQERLKGKQDEAKEASKPREASGSFKPFGGKTLPNNGDTVEFRNSTTQVGVYSEQDGLVYVNGVGHTPQEWRKVDRKQLTEQENLNTSAEQKKLQTFEELGVPPERRGENLHEDNPDLHMSMNQKRVSQVVRSNEETERNKTLTGLAAEQAQK